MDKHDIIEALADAEKAIKETRIWRLGPDGLEEVEERPVLAPSIKSRWTGKPRKNSKQGRRERGGIV